MMNLKIWAWTLGTLAATLYVFCVIYGLIIPATLHWSEAFERVFPGFRWITIGSFLLGLAMSFLYGFFVGALLTPIHNAFYRRWGTAH